MSRLITRNRVIALATGVMLVAAACSGGSGVAPTRDPSLPPHVADASNGEKLFKNESCSACHSTGTRRVTGPGLAGIAQLAATRDAALTADEYLEQAIRDPGAYVLDGFGNLMPNTYSRLPQDDVDDLIAYLKALPGGG
ncbi:MAG: c-type cytochrome [Chloroflexi bacterium]|nr:c-type cytochrome [Chloroflexota bacterium]MBT4073215.1 c-type cytochrome [Chloroflexota bacterium]MBT4515609.1 c-type cytochrome [Chloroflexota bacterium]MBT5318574.1 c-type cytochrome [Chloroflexota bacterium]MBT6681160.1 c-type cytochrome [Chloroflexota bacterium]